MIKLYKTCYSCKYKRGYKEVCKECDLNYDKYELNEKTHGVQVDRLEKFMRDRPVGVSVHHIEKLFGITKSEAEKYYWEWRRGYMKNGQW